jgi:hypothetical protein
MPSNENNELIKTLKPLSEEELAAASGGVRARPTPASIRWHCLECGEYGNWYNVQTEYPEMENSKIEHLSIKSHTRFEFESSK